MLGIIAKTLLIIDLVLWILVLYACLNLKKIIGKAGEFWTKRRLKKLNNEYRVINDVMIKTNDGITHQIDHIVVSKYGIFVIETKQHNAILNGKEEYINWEYKTFYGKKYYIYNPIRQNKSHINALKVVLNIEENIFISIVCITSDTKIDIDSEKIVFENELLEKIKSYNNQIIYNEEEIFNKIISLNITNKKERKQHIKKWKNTKNKKQKKIKINVHSVVHT